MSFTRCTVTLSGFYPIALVCESNDRIQWTLVAMYRAVSPRRVDDNSASFIRELTSHAVESLKPLIAESTDRDTYVRQVEAELMVVLGSASVATVAQQIATTARLLTETLPPIILTPVAGKLESGYSVELHYTDAEGPFIADGTLSVTFEPPMS